MTMTTMAVTMTVFLLMAVTMTIHLIVTFLFGCIRSSMAVPMTISMAMLEVFLLFLALCCLHRFDLSTSVAVSVANISKQQHSNLHQTNKCLLIYALFSIKILPS